MTRPATYVTCPEQQLLVCCARTRMPPEIAATVRALAAGPLDWDLVFASAAENSVTPLLARQLFAVAEDALPVTVFARLKDAFRPQAVRSLVLAAELIKVIDLFRSAGIQAIPYKGPVIAVQAYGDIALRSFEDLDIVLPQRDVAKANELLMDLGYRLRYPWLLSAGAQESLVPGEYHYRDTARGLLVELHTEITLRHFPLRPDLADLASRLVPVSLSGHTIRTLAPEDMLLFLCVHGAKDFWERISWVADIAEFLQAQPLDWDVLFERAASLRLRRMLHLGLALAAGLLDAPLPEEIAARVRRDAVAASLASQLVGRLLMRETAPMGAAEILRFRRRMVEGTFAGWRYFLRLATVPAEEDWPNRRLPRALVPLYGALRPLRLLRKYGLTGARLSRPSA